MLLSSKWSNVFVNNHDDIEDDMVAQIEIGLKLKNIEDKLCLSYSKIDDSYATEIANKLASCNTIKRLDISGL